MVFENLTLDINSMEIVKAILLIFFGVLIAFVVRFFINRLARISIYPLVRKNSPGSYKRTVSGVTLFTNIILWIIVLLFLFQALSVFQIYLLDEIVKLSLSFLPKLGIAFIIIIVGLIVSSILTRKIDDLDFKNSEVVAKLFRVIFVSATILSAMEVININLSPFVDIFKIGLYTLGITFAIAVGIALGFALRPELARVIKNLKENSS